MDDKSQERKGIINAINNPIQLAALIVLVVEGLLAFLLTKANNDQVIIYVSMMVAILIITIIAIFSYEGKRLKSKENIIPEPGKPETQKKAYEWDVFLAAPMAAINEEQFEISQKKIEGLIAVLKEECKFQHIFYAGEGMKTKSDFDVADLSLVKDLNAIIGSRNFLMVYTEKIVTSVLYEAGAALALGKPSFYFGKKSNFPFLMQEANNKFNHVKIHEVDSIDDLIKMIRKHKTELFDTSSVSAK
jgi:hypothetical protein